MLWVLLKYNICCPVSLESHQKELILFWIVCVEKILEKASASSNHWGLTFYMVSDHHKKARDRIQIYRFCHLSQEAWKHHLKTSRLPNLPRKYEEWMWLSRYSFSVPLFPPKEFCGGEFFIGRIIRRNNSNFPPPLQCIQKWNFRSIALISFAHLATGKKRAWSKFFQLQKSHLVEVTVVWMTLRREAKSQKGPSFGVTPG